MIGPTLHSRYMRSGYGAISSRMKPLVDMHVAPPETSIIDSRSAKQTSTPDLSIHSMSAEARGGGIASPPARSRLAHARITPSTLCHQRVKPG